ncbi:hypothetical protein [Paenibacillus sp.]|uniref:hypothetical protein n=1 Tax=Paenibacillus sp. TaxID=58172 RepID=UPI0028123AE0|nr:hypothetical protein [Paenibacillus sp.]
MAKRKINIYLWLLLSLAGYIAAGFLTHFPTGTNEVTEWMLEGAVGGAFQGAIGGILIGGAQWTALRLSGHRFGGRWMLAAVVGFALTHAVGDARPLSVHFVWVGLFCGVLVRFLFWLAQNKAGNVRVWLATGTAVAWIGFAVGLYVADAVLPPGWTPVTGQQRHMMYGLIIGVLQSGATLFLLRGSVSGR